MNKIAWIACTALFALGAGACTAQTAETAEPSAEETASTAEAIGSPTITAWASTEYVSVSGSNMTPGGQVWIGTWNGSSWVDGTNLTAVATRDCAGNVCTVPGSFSGGFSNPQCWQTFTAYAYDYATSTFSNGVSVFVQCPH